MEVVLNKDALIWWRALTSNEQQEIASKMKPHWSFDMFTRSTYAIRQAYQINTSVGISKIIGEKK